MLHKAVGTFFGSVRLNLKMQHAAAELLKRGPVRVKPVNARGGAKQSIAADPSGLAAALDQVHTAELSSVRLVLEENLENGATYSLGEVGVAELVASYSGTQQTTWEPEDTAALVPTVRATSLEG